MKESRDFYLKLIETEVEERRAGRISQVRFLKDEIDGIIAYFDDYLFSLWLSLGDTAFNRLGYRNATDDFLEHLKQRN
jgi:hypothetical protein